MAKTRRKAILDKSDKQDKFIEALKKHHGLLTFACKEIQIAYDTFQKWYRTDEEFKKKVDIAHEQAYEKTTDMVEGKLFQSINKGELTGIIFYLKTKGKKRGYIERTEITGKDGEALFEKDQVSKIAEELAKK